MLEDLSPYTYERACKVRTVANKLEDKDKALLYKYIEDERTWSALGLSKALSEKGISLSDQVIKRHRTKRCSCEQV